jgi:hypothetical protein
MIEVAASVWNEIAHTQKLRTMAAKTAFRFDQEQIVEMERLWMIVEEDRDTPPRVAGCLPTFFPLFTEHLAISQFVSQHPQLRDALPEILDPKEAVTYATGDYRLTPNEQKLLEHTLSSHRTLRNWQLAAAAVARGS